MVFAKSLILTIRKMQQIKYREATAPICISWVYNPPMLNRNNMHLYNKKVC